MENTQEDKKTQTTLNYWELELWSGEIIPVKPSAAEAVGKRFASGEGSIVTPTRILGVKNVKDFRETGTPYNEQKQLESGSTAVIKPVVTHDEAIEVTWCKKSVPRREWTRFYALSGGYRLLEDNDSHVMMAFRVPTHLMTPNVYECSGPEIMRLGRY